MTFEYDLGRHCLVWILGVLSSVSWLAAEMLVRGASKPGWRTAGATRWIVWVLWLTLTTFKREKNESKEMIRSRKIFIHSHLTPGCHLEHPPLRLLDALRAVVLTVHKGQDTTVRYDHHVIMFLLFAASPPKPDNNSWENYVDCWKNHSWYFCTWLEIRCQSSRWISLFWTVGPVSPPFLHPHVQSGPMSSPWKILEYAVGLAGLLRLVEPKTHPLVWPHLLPSVDYGGPCQAVVRTSGPQGPPELPWDGWHADPWFVSPGQVSAQPPGGTQATSDNARGAVLPQCLTLAHRHNWVTVITLCFHGDR